MKGIIDKIIRFYQMRSEALGVVVGNTGKALREIEREKKDNEETEKLQNFAKNMTWDVNNMLTRFYSRKERKEKKCQRLSNEEANALVDFANFTKVLAVSMFSWLNRLRRDETFEEKIDEEIKQLETYVKKRIKQFDEVLEDNLTARGRKFIKCLTKRLGNVVSSIGNFLQEHGFLFAGANRRKSDGLSNKAVQDIEKYFSARNANTNDDRLENLFSGLSINSANRNKESSRPRRKVKV